MWLNYDQRTFQIHLAKWLLKNPVDDQVEYNADEEIQLSEESKDDHSDANK